MSQPVLPEEVVSPDAQPIAVRVVCHACKAKQTERFYWVTVDPAPPTGSDGVTCSHIVTCKKCGAVDDYEFERLERLRLVSQAAAGGGSVMLARGTLWDGSVHYRPSQILARLRELAAEQPDRAEAHRRLGNALERFGLTAEAVPAWQRALELDANDFEAAYSLAEHWWYREQHSGEAVRYVSMAIRALPEVRGSRPEVMRFCQPLAELLGRALEYLRGDIALMAVWDNGALQGQPVVSMSSVDLRKVKDFKGLGDFMARPSVVGLSLVSDLPTDEPTQLQMLLDGHDDLVRARAFASAASSAEPVRRLPAPGRNDPCPCGSGKKYKRCCGG